MASIMFQVSLDIHWVIHLLVWGGLGSTRRSSAKIASSLFGALGGRRGIRMCLPM